MNEDQRKALQELTEWKASLHPSRAEAKSLDDGLLALEEPPERETTTAQHFGPQDLERDGSGDEGSASDEEQSSELTGERDQAEGSASDEDENPRRRQLVDWLVVVGVALLAAFLIRTYVLAHFVVDGTSMASTLEDGDRVFVNKLSYRLHDPRRGDVVVLHQLDGATQRDLIKRVIGLPGESVEMRSCQVVIDGRQLQEPYLDPEVVTPGNCGPDPDFQPVVVPDDHVFVMGDNRAGSQDSRVLGAIDDDDLVGRAFVVFWPAGSWKWL